MKRLAVLFTLLFIMNACSLKKAAPKPDDLPEVTVAYVNSDENTSDKLGSFLRSHLKNAKIQFMEVNSAEELRKNILQGICADIICTDDTYTISEAARLGVFDNITDDDIKKYFPDVYDNLKFCSDELASALKFQNRRYGIPIEFEQQGSFSAIAYYTEFNSFKDFLLQNSTVSSANTSFAISFSGREAFLDKIGAFFCESGKIPSLWYKNGDGSVCFGAVMPDMLPVLKELNKMYAIGAIDKEFVKQSEYMVRSAFLAKETECIGTYFSGSQSKKIFLEENPGVKIYNTVKPANMSLSICINADKEDNRELFLSAASKIADYLFNTYRTSSVLCLENTNAFRAESYINPSDLETIRQIAEYNYADMIINGDVDNKFKKFTQEWYEGGGDKITALLEKKLQ